VSSRVAILDTGSGNLRSVAKALAKVGGEPVITSDPDVVRSADRLVVPGQGAFGEFARAMHERGLEQSVREVIASGRPFLGICLGLQVLFDESEEQGPVSGLGLLSGHVVKFRPDDRTLKVPHMGWNDVARAHHDEPLLAGIPDGSFFYFVHSYYVVPNDDDIVALHTDFGVRFAAAVRKDNLFACQFHPEKSQAVGLRLLANFVEAA
jgi:glutamine amidotransferase